MKKLHSFQAQHPWDRNFFLWMTGIAWIAILSGFINDIIKLNAEGRLHFPLVVHVHAAIFFGWLYFNPEWLKIATKLIVH